MTACYGQLGDAARAKHHVDEVLKRMPDFSARRFVIGEPYKHARLLDGPRKAGLPE